MSASLHDLLRSKSGAAVRQFSPQRAGCDLPLNFQPAVTKVLSSFTPFGAG